MGFRLKVVARTPLPQCTSSQRVSWSIMKTESIISAVFALGTAASAWFAWPFAITAGCAIAAAAFALAAGREAK